jgi:membrane-associated protein
VKKYLKLLAFIFGILLVIFLMTREFELEKIIEAGGLLIIGLTIFAETGLLVGFFLPGDTLLFAAGFIAASGALNIVTTIITIAIAGILGNAVAYEIGKRGGKYVFRKEDSIFFHKKYIERAQHFFTVHGGKTIMFARFIPIVRTLAPMLAGTGRMDYKKFTLYNILGAVFWSTSITLVGFWAGRVLGEYIDIDTYILPIILLATVLTFGTSFYHAIKEEETRKVLIKKIKLNYKSFFKN